MIYPLLWKTLPDIASYADDNTPYTTGNSMEEVIQKLENAAKTLFQWFNDNQMKLTLISVTFHVTQTVKLV